MGQHRRGRRAKGAPPPYLHHKGIGQAYCTLGGKQILLGKHGSKESRAAYKRVIDAWLRDAERPTETNVKPGCTLAELIHAHALHAQTYYVKADGSPTSMQAMFRLFLKPIRAQWGKMHADEFRPSCLREYRDQMVKDGYGRTTINAAMTAVKTLFKWGAAEGLIEPETHMMLRSVPGLLKGRTPAPDYPAVRAASVLSIFRIRNVVLPKYRTIIRLQQLCGARPGEVCAMRASEINRQGIVNLDGRRIKLDGVWIFQPSQYKQLHKGIDVAYVLGPKAQRLLDHLMRSGKTKEFLFESPKNPGHPITLEAYRDALEKAFEKTGAEPFTPNQIRHLFLTSMERQHGLKLASEAVGHRAVSTTQIYVDAENRLRRVADVMAKKTQPKERS